MASTCIPIMSVLVLTTLPPPVTSAFPAMLVSAKVKLASTVSFSLLMPSHFYLSLDSSWQAQDRLLGCTRLDVHALQLYGPACENLLVSQTAPYKTPLKANSGSVYISSKFCRQCACTTSQL